MLKRNMRISPCRIPYHCSQDSVSVGVMWQLERDKIPIPAGLEYLKGVELEIYGCLKC